MVTHLSGRRRFAAAALVALVAIGTPALAGKPEKPGKKPGETIVEIAVANPEKFSTLVMALQKTGLVPALNGNRMFTVFAPNNDAFDAAAAVFSQLGLLPPNSTGVDLVNGLHPSVLTTVLLYHVAPGERFSGDVLSASKIRTISRGFIGVDGTTLKGVGTSANLVKVDTDASNGVIHEIDAVLLPFTL